MTSDAMYADRFRRERRNTANNAACRRQTVYFTYFYASYNVDARETHSTR